MRKMEAASLRWKDIELRDKTFTLYDTKNRENHTLPLPDFIYDLLERRSRNKTSGFVFPANSATGDIYEPNKAFLKVVELGGSN